MSIYILDTETTGKIEPIIPIEIAYRKLNLQIQATGKIAFLPEEVGQMFHGYFKPNKPIEFGAMATHHILEEDLKDAPPYESFTLPEDMEYMLGHNIDYDWKALGCPDIKRIDTCSMARHLVQTDTYSQSALMYYFFRPAFAKQQLQEAHSAKADILNLYWILVELLQLIPKPITSIEELWQYSEECRIPLTCEIGDHRGKPWSEVPSGFRKWMLDKDFDEYVKKAVRKSLGIK